MTILVYSIFVNSAMTLMSLGYLVERTNWKKNFYSVLQVDGGFNVSSTAR